jgi:hypothetical protein
MQPVLLQHPFGQVVASQATHEPDTQIEPEPDPHDKPSLMLLVGLHMAPAEHDMVPVLHGMLRGEQEAFGVHAAQLPCPSHTPLATDPVWHAVPAAAGMFWSVQTIVPPAHDVTLPTWHGWSCGAHDAFTVHALQTPV